MYHSLTHNLVCAECTPGVARESNGVYSCSSCAYVLDVVACSLGHLPLEGMRACLYLPACLCVFVCACVLVYVSMDERVFLSLSVHSFVCI